MFLDRISTEVIERRGHFTVTCILFRYRFDLFFVQGRNETSRWVTSEPYLSLISYLVSLPFIECFNVWWISLNLYIFPNIVGLG